MARSEGFIDFHAHILPGLDHGSRNVAASLGQMRLLSEKGVFAVVATSHFYAHVSPSVQDFLTRRAASLDALRAAWPENEKHPALYLGAEVLAFPGLEKLPGLESLCVGGSRVLLLEMPYTPFSRELLNTVEAIIRRGIIPLFAHIDRYAPAQFSQFFDFDEGLYQLNPEAFLSFGRRRFFRKMAERGEIAALGSDLHGLTRGAYKPVIRALSYLGRAAENIRANSEKLLREATPAWT